MGYSSRGFFQPWVIPAVDYSSCRLFQPLASPAVGFSSCGFCSCGLFQLWIFAAMGYSRCGSFQLRGLTEQARGGAVRSAAARGRCGPAVSAARGAARPWGVRGTGAMHGKFPLSASPSGINLLGTGGKITTSCQCTTARGHGSMGMISAQFCEELQLVSSDRI